MTDINFNMEEPIYRMSTQNNFGGSMWPNYILIEYWSQANNYTYYIC